MSNSKLSTLGMRAWEVTFLNRRTHVFRRFQTFTMKENYHLVAWLDAEIAWWHHGPFYWSLPQAVSVSENEMIVTRPVNMKHIEFKSETDNICILLVLHFLESDIHFKFKITGPDNICIILVEKIKLLERSQSVPSAHFFLSDIHFKFKSTNKPNLHYLTVWHYSNKSGARTAIGQFA